MCVCMFVCLYVCHATLPKHFAYRQLIFQGFVYDATVGSSTTHGRVIYDPRSGHLRRTVGSSTTHGRVIYDATVGSSTTHGRVHSVLFFEIHPAIKLSTNKRITLCSYYIQLSATLCEQLRSAIVQSYVTQGL